MRKLLLFFFMLHALTLCAQDHMSLKKKAEAQYESNDLAGALVTCRAALDAAAKKVGKEHTEYADILHDLGIYHFYEGKDKEGIGELIEAIAIMRRSAGEKSAIYVSTLSDLGSIYYLTGDMSNAALTFEKAIAADEATGTKEHAILLASLAEVERSLGKMKESSEHFSKSREGFVKNRATRTNEYAQLLNNYAGVYHDLAQYTRAEQLYNEAVLVFNKLGANGNPDYVTCIKNFGELYYEMEMYDRAQELLENAEQLNRQMYGENSLEYASVLNDLSLLYKATGDYSRAELLCSRALKLKKDLAGETSASYINTLHNYGMLCNTLGRSAEALEKVKLSVELMKPYKQSMLLKYTEYCSNLASLYTNQHRFAEAEALYQELIKTYESNYGKEAGYIDAMNNLAYLYHLWGDAAKAEKIYMQLMENKKDPLTQQNLAILYFGQQKFSEAEALMKQAYEQDVKKYPAQSPALLDSKLNMAIVLAGNNRTKEAMAMFSDGLKGYMQLLKRSLAYMTEEERIDVTEKIYTKLGYFYTFAIDHNKELPGLSAMAYDYRLATKGLLLNSISREKEELVKSGDTSLINAYTSLKAQRNFLGKLYSLSLDELEEVAVNLDSLQKAADKAEKQLALRLSFLNGSSAQDETWQQVQGALQQDEAAVEIIRLTEKFDDNSMGVTYAAVMITKKSAQPEIILLRSGSGMENNYLENYRSRMLSQENDTASYNIYWKKIGEKLGGINTVYLSADGAYNQLSLATLKDPSTGKYIQEQWDLRLVTSTRDILKKPSQPVYKTAALFGFPDYKMGLEEPGRGDDMMAMRRDGHSRAGKWILPDLPGTRVEVEQVEALMKNSKWKTNVFLKSAATEQNLKSLHNPSVLHIATHGYFSAHTNTDSTELRSVSLVRAVENPLLRSGLMLAGASNAWSESYDDVVTWNSAEDGILTAYEAMSLDLDSTDLVVLSACETGLGEVKNGEGVYGLQRAFMVAGAKNVIMSMWPVNDNATQQLMTLFYQRWLRSGDIHKAFREAQDELKKDFPHPYYWGAFVLLGR